MNEDILLATILTSSYTKQDVLRRLRLLREYFEQKYFAPTNLSPITIASFLKKSQASQGDTQVLPSLPKEFYESFSKDTVYDLLNAVSEKVKTLPTIHVYMPFAPDEKEASKLGSWFRQQVKGDILLEIHVDRSMVGGIGFALNGYFRDYSLRHYIDKKRDDIKNILARYDHPKV